MSTVFINNQPVLHGMSHSHSMVAPVCFLLAITVCFVRLLEISQSQKIQSFVVVKDRKMVPNQHLQLAHQADRSFNITKPATFIPSKRIGSKIPVVSVHFSDSTIAPVYVWKSLLISAQFDNDVVLISSASAVPDDVTKAGIRSAALKDFETPELLLFRQKWGPKSIVERQNSERFLILKRFMQIEGIDWVFFVDPEVALLTNISLQILEPGCDTMLVLDKHSSRQKWDSAVWSAWPGAAVINRRVLEDFSNFALGMLTPPFIDLLALKRQSRPQVPPRDRALWYLFAGAADPSLAAAWAWNSSSKSVSLPGTRGWTLCDGTAVGFAGERGYTPLPDGRLQLDPTAKMVRFPVQRRNDPGLLLAQVLQSGKAASHARARAAANSSNLPPPSSPPPPPPPTSIRTSFIALPRDLPRGTVGGKDSESLTVVYMFFANEGKQLPAYAWATIRVTAQHGNDVVVITSKAVQVPAEVRAAGVRIRAMEGLETPAQLRFRKAFSAWDTNRWERQNSERYFVLLRHMELEGLERVFFADSDVALLTRVGPGLVPPGCDTMLSLQNNSAKMQWATRYWAAWAGTAVLGRQVLADFAAFAQALFKPQHLGVLRHKLRSRPYVCDMTVWYLFAGRADPACARAWGFKAAAFPLPPVRRAWRFCDSTAAGFGHAGGYEISSNGTLAVQADVKSVHFQGGRKQDALLLLKSVVGVGSTPDQGRLRTSKRP